MLATTVSQLLINEALPEELRDHNRVLDKKALQGLLREVATKYPDKYRDISFKLNQIGRDAIQEQGGYSLGLRHLRRSKVANEIRERIQSKMDELLADTSMDPKKRKEAIIRLVGGESENQQKAVMAEALAAKNPLALQVASGSRGKPMNLASLLASDMLYSDHKDEVIPLPVLRSYSEGLSLPEYWAGTYGARRGIISTKFATQDGGFFSKQLNQTNHRLLVVGEDSEEDQPEDMGPTLRGFPVDTDDMDNEGALLAHDAGPYKKNTALTPKILKHLSRLGKKRILVRSAAIGGSPDGGVYARDVGVRAGGKLPGRGEFVGFQAAQALAEPISQGALSAKHSGGVAGQEKSLGGFQYLNQLLQVPKKMKGGAAHATEDGTVERVEESPAGGYNVYVNNVKHYVPHGFEVTVKKGDQIEAGDMISDGIPNPAIITQYKGIGEGKRYFINEFRKSMGASGLYGNRRNIELLSRGLINHVRLTQEMGDHVQDDVVPYTTLEHTYRPRADAIKLSPQDAIGHYLERPVLHHSIGTKVRPSMLKDFQEFGVTGIDVHRDPPPFEPVMIRGMSQLQNDPDWMTQMYGSGLKKSLLNSVARGATSDTRGTSFVPSLAGTLDFGSNPNRAVIKPQAPYQLPKVPLPPDDDFSLMPKSASFSLLDGIDIDKIAVDALSVSEPTKIPTNTSTNTPTNTPAPPAPSSGLPGTPGLKPSTPSAPAPVPKPSAPNQNSFQVTMGRGPTTRLPSTRMDMGLPPVFSQPQQPPQQAPTAPTSPPAAPAPAQPPVSQPTTQPTPAVPQPTTQPAAPQPMAREVPEIPSFGTMPEMLMPGVPSMDAPDFDINKFDVRGYLKSLAGQNKPRTWAGFGRDVAQGTWDTAKATPGALFEGYTMSSATPGIIGGMVAKRTIPGLGEAVAAAPKAATRWGRLASTAGRFGLQAIAPGADLGYDAVRGARALAQAGQAVPEAIAGAGAAGGVGWLGGARALGTAGLAGAGGYAGMNGIIGLINKTGLIPQTWGGDGTWIPKMWGGNSTWDPGLTQRQFDDNLQTNGIVSKLTSGFHSPVESVTYLGREGWNGLSGGAVSTYDTVTGSSPIARNAYADKMKSQAMEQQRQQQLQQQKQQLAATAGTDPKAQRQLANMDALIQESVAKSQAMEDETAKWRVGSKQFKGNIANSLQSVQQQLQDPNLDPALKTQLQQQQSEYANLLKAHEREVGYLSNGMFGDAIRNSVMGKKRLMAELQSKIQQAQNANDPLTAAKLQRQVQNLETGLQTYRGWAGQ